VEPRGIQAAARPPTTPELASNLRIEERELERERARLTEPPLTSCFSPLESRANRTQAPLPPLYARISAMGREGFVPSTLGLREAQEARAPEAKRDGVGSASRFSDLLIRGGSVGRVALPLHGSRARKSRSRLHIDDPPQQSMGLGERGADGNHPECENEDADERRK
jgi:hypothetical protein